MLSTTFDCILLFGDLRGAFQVGMEPRSHSRLSGVSRAQEWWNWGNERLPSGLASLYIYMCVCVCVFLTLLIYLYIV